MQKQKTVLVLLDRSRAPACRILRGIVKYSNFIGQWRIRSLPPFYRHPRSKKKILSEAKDSQINGIIAEIDDIKMGQILYSVALPAIVIPYKDRISGFPYIFDEGDTPGQMAAQHLLCLGLRNFAFCGFENLVWSQARGKDFSERIVEAGLQTDFYKMPRSRVQRLWESEQIILADWLKTLRKPIGVMACNDDRGQNVIEACQIAGLCVPDDVAVIGVDNDELICDLTDPPLSSVALNHEQAGYKAAELLGKIMADKKVDNEPIISLEASDVVVRQSTNVLAIDDPELIKAIRFIHNHSREAIQVSDVVKGVSVSRRVLERRFREVFKKSVHDQVRHARIQCFSRMLATST